MQSRHFRGTLYFISVVIVATIAIQFYWNYKNYWDGKQQLIREIQSSVDQAIDSYFIDLAERKTVAISIKGDGNLVENAQLHGLLRKIDSSGQGLESLNFIDPKSISEISIIKEDENISEGYGSLTKGTDANHEDITQLARRIIISLKADSLEIPVLNREIDKQLTAKKIAIDYGYTFANEGVSQQFNSEIIDTESLRTSSNSAYLPKDSTFDIYVTNVASTVLQRNSLGIILSALLVIAVVLCLFFLLKIINRQKQLSELKNDLISNITHEFKTPISTAKVALEGIQHFNQENDPEKTKNYLEVSHNQLNKLQHMVEKLLETATLDGGNLELNIEEVSVVALLSDLVEKYRQMSTHIEFHFSANPKENLVHVDPFHLENALNNLLDNAVKYGGEIIEVMVYSKNDVVKIGISDSGSSLTREHAEHIFDKFYRVPRGNRHDVKGFGIGLFYTKKVIEKHGGKIELNLNNKTSFNIIIPKDA